MNTRTRKIALTAWRWILTTVILLIILVPLYWIFISSITPATELFSSPIDYTPDHPTLNNYVRLFVELDLTKKIVNTLIITVCAILFSTVICTMAAYAIARYTCLLTGLVQAFVLASALIPNVVTARPLYDFMRSLKLTDTIPGLIVLYTSELIPFTMLILNNFLCQIPKTIEEAAEMDGAGFVRKMLHVTFPLLRPAIATVCIINFITCVNDLFIPLFYANKLEVLSVAITKVPSKVSNSLPWDMISTMGWIIICPILIVVVVFQKKIMGGIMAGGIKE